MYGLPKSERRNGADRQRRARYRRAALDAATPLRHGPRHAARHEGRRPPDPRGLGASGVGPERRRLPFFAPEHDLAASERAAGGQDDLPRRGGAPEQVGARAQASAGRRVPRAGRPGAGPAGLRRAPAERGARHPRRERRRGRPAEAQNRAPPRRPLARQILAGARTRSCPSSASASSTCASSTFSTQKTIGMLFPKKIRAITRQIRGCASSIRTVTKLPPTDRCLDLGCPVVGMRGLGCPMVGMCAAAPTGDDVGGLGGGERGTEAAGAGQGGSSVLT